MVLSGYNESTEMVQSGLSRSFEVEEEKTRQDYQEEDIVK